MAPVWSVKLEELLKHFDLQYGFSVYKNVLVVWDEDEDPRVLSVLDDMPDQVIRRVFAVSEHEGMITIAWRGARPTFAPDGVCAVDGDEWSVDHVSIRFEQPFYNRWARMENYE